MQKADITKRIADTGAMAIVRVETIERGYEIAQGCLDGGVDCLEIQLYKFQCGRSNQRSEGKIQRSDLCRRRNRS